MESKNRQAEKPICQNSQDGYLPTAARYTKHRSSDVLDRDAERFENRGFICTRWNRTGKRFAKLGINFTPERITSPHSFWGPYIARAFQVTRTKVDCSR